jgi:hypothetical protein
MLSAAGALMSVEERVRACKSNSPIRAANDVFGLFEPIRQILVGKRRRTAMSG